MQYLKQSTTINIKLGPFLDRLDGYTEETGLTPAVEISKNGGSFASRNSATAVAHDAEGWYTVELDTTDTNTLGRLVVKAQDNSTHLPVWQEYSIFTINAYDTLFSTDNLDVNVVSFDVFAQDQIWGYGSRSLTEGVDILSISGDSAAADNLELDYDGTGYNKTNSTIGTATSITNTVTLASATHTGAVIPTVTTVTNQVSADVTAISGDSTSADNLELAFDGTGYDLGGIDVSELNQIVDDLINGGRLDLLIDAIKSKTDQLTFTTANKIDSRVDNWAGTAVSISATTALPEVDVASISNDAAAANNLELDYDGTGYDKSNSTIGTVTNVTEDIAGGSGASPAEIWGYGWRSLTEPVDLQTATQASIDAIEADTNEIQGKLPTGDIADEANISTHVTTSLNTYDPPTRTELTSDKNEIITEVQGISVGSGSTPAEIWGYVSRSLTDGVDVLSISGDSVAADNAELFFDNTGFVASNSTIGTVTTITEEVTGGSGASAAEVWGYVSRSLTDGVDVLSISGNVETAENLVSMFSPYGYVKASFWQFQDQDIEIVSSIDANLTTINGNTTPVDNLEDDYDGTGYDKENSTINLSATSEAQIDAIEASVTTIQGKLPLENSVPDIYEIWGYDSRTLTSSSGVSPETETQIDNIETIISKLDDTVEDDGGIYRFTTNALEQAPSGAGVVEANLTQIAGTVLSETNPGNLAGSFENFFDVQTPEKDINDVGTATVSGGVDVTSIGGYNLSEYVGQNLNEFFDVFPMKETTVNDVRDIKILSQIKGR